MQYLFPYFGLNFSFSSTKIPFHSFGKVQIFGKNVHFFGNCGLNGKIFLYEQSAKNE